MDSLDLNISNYNLEDLLKLFHLPHHFTEEHLRDAKKIVLKTHPDKSNLDKKYFLFFSKAYKYLLKIHELRKSSNTKNTEYINDDLWEQDNQVIINNKIESMSYKEYHKWFNELFEKTKLKDEVDESGYGTWLKSDDDIPEINLNNKAEVAKYMEEKRNHLRSLIVYNSFEDTSHDSHFDLIREKPADYGSTLFDKLQFEDLKKAHTETLIPVTEEDFKNRKKYRNIDEMNRDRTKDIIENKEWFSSHDEKLKQLQSSDDSINISRAYKLLQQDEVIRDNYDKFWTDLKRIENK